MFLSLEQVQVDPLLWPQPSHSQCQIEPKQKTQSSHIPNFVVYIQRIPDIWIHSKNFLKCCILNIFKNKGRGKTNLMYHCCPSYFMAINLPWIKNKQQFLQNYQKTNDVLHWYLDIISWIIFNPLKLPTSQQLSFCADQCWSFTAVIHFKINFKTTFRSLLLCIRFCEIGCNIFFFKLCKFLFNEHKNSFF